MDANGGTLSLGSLVSSYEKLEVDDYQRPYTWSKDEIEELFADLDDCVRDKTPHFFGTLILQQVNDKHVKVVDGQQRLTTSFILVAALRDELLSLPVRTISGGVGHVEVYVPQKVNEYLLVENQVDRHRFSPNRTIRDLMQNVVMAAKHEQRAVPKRDRSQGETTLKFRKAVTHIRKTVAEDLAKKVTDEEKLVRINELLEALLKRFHLLRVLTSDDAESLDIFLTLNNRGVPLGPSDLVRGEVLKRLGANLIGKPLNDLHKTNLSEWNAISEAVKEPEAFLRHYLVSISDEKVQKKKVVDTVMKVLRSQGTSTDEEERAARKFWSDLKAASEIYGKVVTPFTTDLPKNSAKCYLVLLNGLM
jgi:transcriptional regulator of heat shock response